MFSPSQQSGYSLCFMAFLKKVFLSLSSLVLLGTLFLNLVPLLNSSSVLILVVINLILLRFEPALAQVLFPSATRCYEFTSKMGICLAQLCFFKSLESWCVYCLLTLRTPGLLTSPDLLSLCILVHKQFCSSKTPAFNGFGCRAVSNGFQFREISL